MEHVGTRADGSDFFFRHHVVLANCAVLRTVGCKNAYDRISTNVSEGGGYIDGLHIGSQEGGLISKEGRYKA